MAAEHGETGEPRVPAAASMLCTDLLDGPPGHARVLAAFPTALYLGSDRHDRVLPVLARDALLLPTALRLAVPSDDVRWGVVTGALVRVGNGCVALPALEVVAVRRWRPARVTASPRAPGHAQRERVLALLGEAVSDSPLRDVSADLARAALTGSDVRRALGAMVGAGRGLTPSGDDALCGVLLTLRGAGLPDAAHHALGEATAAALSRTTSLSASLLRAAVDGYAVPEVVSLVRAVSTGDAPAVVASLPAVLRIGHSSGADLAGGVLGALDALTAALHDVTDDLLTQHTPHRERALRG